MSGELYLLKNRFPDRGGGRFSQAIRRLDTHWLRTRDLPARRHFKALLRIERTSAEWIVPEFAVTLGGIVLESVEPHLRAVDYTGK